MFTSQDKVMTYEAVNRPIEYRYLKTAKVLFLRSV